MSQMGDVFEKDRLMAHRNVVHQNQMLMDLAHVADVGNDRDTKFARKQADREEFAYSAEAGAIRLEKANASGLKVVLEHHASGNVLSDRDRNWSYDFRESMVRIDIVRVRRLFDPKGGNARQFFGRDNRIRK